jgi:hypothetical protein
MAPRATARAASRAEKARALAGDAGRLVDFAGADIKKPPCAKQEGRGIAPILLPYAVVIRIRL